MNPRMNRIGGWLYRRAEDVLAAMLAVMFFAFLLQIFFRYVMNWPTGWTNELSAILWIWIVLWGAAFVLTEQEEMRFDLIYASVGPRVRSAMFLICAASIILLYGISLPAVVDYVSFMKVESSAYMKIRFDWVFCIYVVFVIAIIMRYLWLSWQVLRGSAPEEFDPTKAGSGV
ncbi:TRAP transporter small permease subunit [Aminobacter carboxidus]|uniref:TRAP transporter small permease protein n=2 Tax=Aminobacter carboxidus TaxID=376165 RepID=A0A8E2BF55_9HYPH|nr:TRAP transporter small permease subunit [Aminobacter carboxidus]MBB6468382.1 TRAP-type C4-dicarboxylate transport system permease small subunit [Aminobacter lissarensis]MBE1207974.1 TRAP transporter small permease subunit [Aminobacter carboxidus]